MMMFIERASSNAVISEVVQSAIAAVQPLESMRYLTLPETLDLSKLDDYDLIDESPFQEEHLHSPWQISTDSPTKYLNILFEAHKQLGLRNKQQKSNSEAKLYRFFNHEMTHFRAAEQVGILPFLTLDFHNKIDGELIYPHYSTLVFRREKPIIKLALAAIAALPDDSFNSGDIGWLQQVGYEGREDVAARIAKHNDTYHRHQLPVVGSHRRGT